ncbi:MAG TPA: acetate kinase [Clostridiales bacterium]|nr:acetate kinase [Clostridiales bacterium]
MKILVINTGSSSLKYQLIDMTDESVLAKGLCERIGSDAAVLKHAVQNNGSFEFNAEMPDHKVAVAKMMEVLMGPETGVIQSMDEITAVAHRVVHGGEKFKTSALITDEVMDAIRECVILAPLHNPPNIIGIEACMNMMPGIPMVAVFDTAFHSRMPRKAYMYGLPYEFYEKYGIRKYGFHGTSHKYVTERAAKLLKRPLKELKLISCHLGNGASLCAVKDGKSVDTSMGFTPLDGLIMGTRSGTLDPAILTYLMEFENLDFREINDVLNKKSGLLGISGVSNDLRDIVIAAAEGNERADLAIELFVYRIKSYIGSYMAIMGGVDAVIFTAGIGENNWDVRRMVMEGIEGAGVDPDKNRIRSVECDVSTDTARVRTLVIPTNEELELARETMITIQNGNQNTDEAKTDAV